jgi:CheY-like chemotaxis protein/HPt (histidine-containing phosphotransfer) domain-containing protein
MVAVRMLEKLGCRVDVASDGREAVEMVGRLPYDLVFMDCQMPEMDGYEATAAIRKRGDERARVPIVAMTADAIVGTRQRCLDAGMDGYLSKPITASALREVLQRHAPAPAAGAGAAAPPSVESPSPAPGRAIDLRTLAANTADDPALLARVATAYLADEAGMRTAIREAATAGDVPALHRAAHRLVGSLLSLAAGPATACARRLEAVPQGAPAATALAIVDDLEAELDRVRRELAGILQAGNGV